MKNSSEMHLVGHVIDPVRDSFLDVMRHAIALNGSFFNTRRMVLCNTS